MALQSGASFARHYYHSSATQVDRDFGSGKLSDFVQEPMFPMAAGTRYGEALHPGPEDDHSDYWLTVGVTNPGGVRAKEDMLLAMGPGIWTLTETQLSQITTKSTARTLRSGGHKLHRNIRAHFRHPAPLRHGSQWAGRWTGVCTTSDWPSTSLQVPWPDEHWETGRVLLTRHWVNGTPISVGGFYGYAQGPTWPKARHLSDQLLTTFTKEVVVGMQGIRLLVGDFNQEPGVLRQQQIWEQYGWCNAQQYGVQALAHEWSATCKHATEPDQIWLSPEAARLLRAIALHEHFADHCTLEVKLQLPQTSAMISRWPRPAPIPWDMVDKANWSPCCTVRYEDGIDSTEFMKQWAAAYEKAIDTRLQEQGQPAMKPNSFGRAQRLQPDVQEQQSPICKPSREGEITLQSTLVGAAVRCWFKQLRRLQSLCHALKADKQTPAAVCYRASLWTAITRAHGFHPDFPTWWRNRDSPCDGAPTHFPDHLPACFADVQVLFLDFLHHFRKFEKWHLGQRQASLKAKYEGSLSSIFKDLRDDHKGNIDHVWKDVKHQILAVDVENGQIMLDSEIQTKFDSLWFHDGSPVQVLAINGVVCTVSNCDSMEPEDEIVQRIFVSDVSDVLDLFTQHWQPRWNLLNSIPEETWLRVVQFTQAYMPKVPFSLPELTVEDWRKSVTKFKNKAARGPDGWAREDLLYMPQQFVEPLLHLLNNIEQGNAKWPQQLLYGAVIGTPKCKQPHEEAHFRPITLFSMLFRCWSKLRTKQMLQQIAMYMPAEALGFLPHRETTEIWLLLQAQIEVMLMYDEPLCGLSSDVRRAFNHIGRRQVVHMGEHIGFPQHLLNAWGKFLNHFVRRFDINGCLGHSITSDSGYPEGDPLSIVAMLTVNWGYHVYMKVFMPKIQAFSFVDNMTLAARDAIQVIQGHFAMSSFMTLFGLSMDDEKTFVWGLSRQLRQVLQQLGYPCLFDASELGASMTYGRQIRNRLLKARGLNMDGKWQKLKHSMAPLSQKICMLPKVFWPRALHGSPSCVFADTYLTTLRRAAVKALTLNGAGSNPLLRLSLSNDMCSDPGFYQLKHTIATLRRLVRKAPDLLPWWQLWQQKFDGHLRPGPFTKVTTCLNQIGWSVLQPPFVMDHQQHSWNLMRLDEKTLTTLLEDAWCQYLAAHTRHQTMKDLHGMDHFLTTMDYGKLTPVERTLLSALQSGAFISASEHAKYDVEKMHICGHCQCEDDRAHWLLCPRFQHVRQSITGWHHDNVELPVCMTHHLLIPKLQALEDWRNELYQIPDRTSNFLVVPPKTGLLHLFTDGASSAQHFGPLRLAAWGVLCTELGEAVALGHLHGITQTIDRAELAALLAATRWTQEHDICIWSDSQSTVNMAEFIQKSGFIHSTAENYDMWLDFQAALNLRDGSATHFRWVPSHVHPCQAGDPFEHWAFHWNNVIDEVVTRWNWQRPQQFMNKLANLERKLEWWWDRANQLRQFYFRVAELEGQQEASSFASEIIEISDEEVDMAENDLIADQLPLNWAVRCRQAPGKVPGTFTEQLLQWLCAAEQLGGPQIVVRDLGGFSFG